MRFPTLPPTLQAGLLVMIAGYADAIGFLHFDAFAGQMTGNTILLALSIAKASWSETAFYVAVILSFVIGVVISGSLVRLGHPPVIALTMSAVALAVAAFVTAQWGALLLAVAMGAQNAATTRFGQATINTVFITGDLQKLFEAVLDWLWPGKGRQTPPDFAILALVWAEYFLGALAGAVAHLLIAYPLLVPAALLPLVLLGRPGRAQ